MEENTTDLRIEAYKPYAPDEVPGPDDLLDDLLVALGRDTRRYRAGLDGFLTRVTFETLGKVAVCMAKIARELRNPLDGRALGSKGTDELRATVERLRAEDARRGRQ
jgi:hypothetical protein